MCFLVSVFAIVLLFFQLEVSPQADFTQFEDQPLLLIEAPFENAGTITITNSESFFGSPHNLPVQDTGMPAVVESMNNSEWMLWFLLAGFVVFSIAWFNFPSKCKRSLYTVFGLRFFYQLDKEGGFFWETHNYLLFFNFLIVLSLLIYQSLSQSEMLNFADYLNQEYVYGLIFLIILSFYILKLLFVRFLAWVFNTRRASTIYLENIFVFNQFVGVVLLPLVFHNAFSPSSEMIYAMWIIVIGANAYKVIRGSFIANNVSGFSAYYLFLYLCAVELMPLLIAWRLVTNYMSDL